MTTTNPQLASSFGVEGMFALTFHQSQPVGDHEDPALQPVFEQQVPHSGPCYLAQVPTQDSDGVVSGGSDAFLLPMEWGDTFAISANIPIMSNYAFKLVIEVDGINAAVPYRYVQPTLSSPGFPQGEAQAQDYFIASPGIPEEHLRIDGIAIPGITPRTVRQFVALPEGTPHSFKKQLDRHNDGTSILITVFLGHTTFPVRVNHSDTSRVTTYIFSTQTGAVTELKEEIYIRERRSISPQFVFDGGILSDQPYSETIGGSGAAYCMHTSSYFRSPNSENTSLVPLKATSAETQIVDKGQLFFSTSMDLHDRTSRRKLEVAPGGLIRQGLPEDQGQYYWEKMPMGRLSIQIVSPDEYRSLTGAFPLQPQPPLKKAKITSAQYNDAPNPNPGTVKFLSVAHNEHLNPSQMRFYGLAGVSPSSSFSGSDSTRWGTTYPSEASQGALITHDYSPLELKWFCEAVENEKRNTDGNVRERGRGGELGDDNNGSLRENKEKVVQHGRGVGEKVRTRTRESRRRQLREVFGRCL